MFAHVLLKPQPKHAFTVAGKVTFIDTRQSGPRSRTTCCDLQIKHNDLRRGLASQPLRVEPRDDLWAAFWTLARRVLQLLPAEVTTP